MNAYSKNNESTAWETEFFIIIFFCFKIGVILN